MVTSCVTCGSQMDAKPRGRKPKYCSMECRTSATATKNRNHAQKTARACPNCLTIFFAKGQARFCSAECRVSAYKAAHNKGRHPTAPIEMTCAHCGVSFMRKPKTDNRRPHALKFCSKSCIGAANLPHPPRRQGQPATPTARLCTVSFPTCHQCGVVFSSHYPRRYCSERCKYVGYYLKASGRDMTPRPCGWCGVTIAPEVGTWKHKFCSLYCSRKYQRKKNTKHRHSMRKLRNTLGLLGTGVQLRELPTPIVEAAKALRALRQEIHKQWNPVVS